MAYTIVENEVNTKGITMAFSGMLLFLVIGFNVNPQVLQYPQNEFGIVELKFGFLQDFFRMHEAIDHPHIYIYYQTHCPHCHTFMPKYQEVSKYFRENYPNQISFSQTDIEKERAVYRDNPQYAPAIYAQKGNLEIEYEGTRETENMILWLEDLYKDQLVKVKKN